MVLDYLFKTNFIGRDEERNEEYYNEVRYEYEIDANQEEEIAIEMIMQDIGCDKELARKIVENVLYNNDILDDYLKANKDYVKEHFEDDAQKEFYED